MLKKKWLWISVIVVIILLIGGKVYMNKKNKFEISKEQQNNVASWILRSYKNVNQIKFLKSYKNLNTGSVGVNFRLNNDKNLEGGIVVYEVSEFDDNNGTVGLNPISKFEKLVPIENDETTKVDLSDVTITYLEEQ